MDEPRVYFSGGRGAGGDYLSRWKRIIHIDRRIRQGDHPNATSLARECGVSAKTIHRDIDALRLELDAPIEYDAKERGYRYADPSFAIPSAALSEKDLFALMVAENAIAQYEGTPLVDYLRGAFDKILALLPGDVREAHELAARAVYFSGLPPARLDPQCWTSLTTSIQAREEVEIQYFLPREGRPTTRRVHPYLLVVRDREWFLVAYLPDSDRTPLYYLPRIRAVQRLGTHFKPQREFSPDAYYRHGFNAMHGGERLYSVVLRFQSDHAYLAHERDWAPRQKVTHHRDGSSTVRFRSAALFEIERQVLRYGGTVEVVQPAELRRSTRAAAKRLVATHG